MSDMLETTLPAEDEQGRVNKPNAFGDALKRFHYTPIPTRTLRSSTRTPLAPSTLTPTPTTPPRSTRKRKPSAPPDSPAPTPKNPRRKAPSKYAPPTKYAHLPPLIDILAPNLLTVFIGTNPGIRTSTSGHAYAHPSNQFWKLLHVSGITSRRLAPSEDGSLPARWQCGNTNLVARPTRDAAELSKGEMSEGARALERKIAECRPESVCVVGKGIWEAVWRARYGRAMRSGEFSWGWQDERENMGRCGGDGGEAGEDGWRGARVYVTTSTSGLSASLRPHEKEAIWRPFGEWVQQRRRERAAEAVASDEATEPDADAETK